MPAPGYFPSLAMLSAALLGLGGCQRETTPPLIQLTELAPREVEAGDRVQLVGVGFPEGKIAHVAFQGDLARPGLPPVRSVEIDVDAVVVSSTQIELPMNEALTRSFAGAGDRAVHTTFSGDVRVAFAASSPASPPVEGTLREVWLDVRPATPHRAIAEAEAAEGERTLQFLGIRASAVPVPAGGVLVESIAPASRAESAHLLAGDVLTELDGVRVLSTRDLVAASGARTAWLKIRRGGNPREEIAELSLVGLAPSPASALLGPLLVLGLAAILVLFAWGPVPDAMTWLERRISGRLLVRSRNPAASRGAPFGSFARGPLVVLGASATFGMLPLAHALGIGDLDVAVLFVIGAASLAIAAFATGRPRAPARFAFRASLARLARVVSLEVPGALAVVAAVAMTGSLRLDDIVHAQGGWPWQWTAFASPPTLGLLAIWLLTALTPRDDRASSPAADLSPLFMGGLAAALLLGGWQIPGVAPEQVEAHLGWTLLGAAIFVGKAWLLVLAVLAGRWTLPVLEPRRVLAVSFRVLIPLSLFFLLLTALWTFWGPAPGARTLIGAVTLALGGAAAAHVATRVRSFLREPAGQPELDPFL